MRVPRGRLSGLAVACCVLLGLAASVAEPAAAAVGETVLPFGDAGFYGSTASVLNTQPVTAMAATPDGQGYWETASDGGVFAFGDAGFYGSMGAVRLNAPVTAMAATPDGGGYWLAASDGGVFAFGDAGFYGSMGAVRLNAPVTAMAATPDGRGYWLAASDGGVFAFGDAGFYGSGAAIPGIRSVVGIARSPDGLGYWLAAADGGVFAFGDAGFYGSGAPIAGIQPVSGVAATPDGRGYWLTARDGGVFAFGDAGFFGSAAGLTPGRLVVGIERSPSGLGYWLLVRNTPVGPIGSAASPPAAMPAPVATLPTGTPPVALGVNVYFGQVGKTSCDAVFPVTRAVQPPQVLAGAMNALLAGPTSAEQAAGYTSYFSSQTAGMLNWAHVGDGVARIDFANFSAIIPNASSSCGSSALLASLDTTAEQFASVDSAIYSFNGNIRAFYLWLQLTPPPGY